MSCDGPLGVPLPGDTAGDHPVLSLVPSVTGTSPAPVQDRSSGPSGPQAGPAAPGPEGVSGPEPEDTGTGPGTGGELVLADSLPGRDMTSAERFLAFLKSYGKRVIAKPRKGSTLAGMVRRYLATPPESSIAHHAYISSPESRKWIPEGYENYRLIRFLRGVQVVFHKTVAPAGVALGAAIGKTCQRGRHLAAVLGVLVVIVILIVAFA